MTESPSESAIREWCVDYLSRTLDLPQGQIDPQVEFARLGLDSASSIHFLVALEEWLGLELTQELIFEHPTVADLARHLADCGRAERGPG
ncbi:MAG TPA: acyl carrier protein [Stellaceae bacterium]|nr:acyl carrier protein [Stellaceae bacterium]